MKHKFVIPNEYFDIDKIMNSGQLALIYKLFDNRYICISEMQYCFVVVRANYSYVMMSDIGIIILIWVRIICHTNRVICSYQKQSNFPKE